MRPAFSTVLLLTSCALLCSPAAVAGDIPVRDTSGNPLRRGDPYYVLPVDYGDGGVNVGSIGGRDSPCPREVWLRPGPPAEPVLFFPNDSTARGRTVLLEDLILVMFAELLPCPGSTLWTLNDTTGYVTTGGVSPSSASDVDSSYDYYGFFRIGSYEDGVDPGQYYRLYSCPTPVAERRCSTIGVTPVGGVKRYTFPLAVQFEKVSAEGLVKMPKKLMDRAV